jgi:hypothetical protein
MKADQGIIHQIQKSKNKIKTNNVEKADQGRSQTYEKIKLQFWMRFEA